MLEFIPLRMLECYFCYECLILMATERFFRYFVALFVCCLWRQCRIKVGAIDATALGPFKKQAHGHGRENEKSLLYFGCDFSGRYTFGKNIKIVATDVIF